jgi:hypothetical protein
VARPLEARLQQIRAYLDHVGLELAPGVNIHARFNLWTLLHFVGGCSLWHLHSRNAWPR